MKYIAAQIYVTSNNEFGDLQVCQLIHQLKDYQIWYRYHKEYTSFLKKGPARLIGYSAFNFKEVLGHKKCSNSLSSEEIWQCCEQQNDRPCLKWQISFSKAFVGNNNVRLGYQCISRKWKNNGHIFLNELYIPKGEATNWKDQLITQCIMIYYSKWR